MIDKMNQCIFCQVAEGKLKSEIVYQDDKVVVFKDINPKKPIHWLVIPRKHIDSISGLEERDVELAGHLLLTIKKLAAKHRFADDGYRVIVNTRAHGGQEVDHLHLHVLAGEHAGPMVS